MAKQGGQESSLDSLGAREETLRGLYGCHQPQRRVERSNQMTGFFFLVLPRREMSIFSFASARYLDHLCVVTTAWVFPAIQSHTKAPHRDPFSPASRQLYSTHPDNNSQPGAFILMLLCARNSPYPEPAQVKVHRSSTLIPKSTQILL